MRKRAFSCVTVLSFLIATASSGQQLSTRMANQDVIDMVSLGLSDDLIIDKIHNTQGTNFDTSVSGLRTLKAAQVSDAVIRAMINSHPSGAEERNPAATNGGSGLPPEVGVYIVLRGALTEIEPEIVNWQTGGWIKSHASLGLVKGDANGKVMKAKSAQQVTEPTEFLIKTPEGTSVTEYQLLRLHEKSDRREFRSVTGGVLHVSGGAQRDQVAFQPEKIGNRTWRIRLENLPRGEYGFLPPGIQSASISASGKMYTFGVIEADSTQRVWNFSQGQDSAEAATPTRESSSSAAVANGGSIGAWSDENPNVRHDGVTLSRVAPGGPADQAGIKPGDVILAIDDKYLFTAGELKSELGLRKPGSKIAVRYRRHSIIFDIYLVLESTK